MNEQTLIPWLTLHFASKLSINVIHQLLAKLRTPSQILRLEIAALEQLGLTAAAIKSLKHPNYLQIEKALRWAEQSMCHIISFDDANYPAQLKEIANPPIILYAKGDISILKQSQIAIVGSRNPTPTGRESAEQFAFALSQIGFCITSGLAIGIDSCAHRGALKQKGATIAVLGSGQKQLYPRRNQELAQQIIAQAGLILTEFPLMTPPQRAYFPQRNRIISGLSLGTLIVEATLHSGSLITAHCAIDQGREVFAMPSSIYNPLAKGCHHLIRQGAKLVESTEDILEELSSEIKLNKNLVDDPQNPKQDKLSTQGLDKYSQILLDCFGFETISVDQLVKRSGLNVATVAANLSLLEIEGYITPTAGGYIRVR